MIKIFIVDDDESLQRLYKLILKEAGFEVIETAINGKEAIEKYNKLEIKPDIILMDHRMPGKNGLDSMVEILKTHVIDISDCFFTLGGKRNKCRRYMC